MYVIYPAEEIINLTYGVAAVQRPTLQRPTLDNLREPIVPVGTRTPTPTASIIPPLLSANNNNNHKQSIYNQNSNVFVNDDRKNLNIIDTSDFDETITLNNFNGNRVNYYTPPSSPSLDPGTSATTTITADKPPQSPPNVVKGKPKSKLQLKLAKLGRPHSTPEPAESTRILEYHDIRVSNPTFTRDNLRQRNFDAFFESGEPVYSIETKEKTSSPASTEPSPIDDSLFIATQPPPKKSSKLNFLKRNKQPSPQKQQSAPGNLSRRGSDILLIVEEPQKEPTKTPRLSIFGSKDTHRVTLDPALRRMATASGGGILRDLGHPGLNDTLKVHNSVTFKLVKTVSDFTETLAQIYEQHAEALQLLVSSYRKKNTELRKERPACQSSLFYAWEVFLQEIEADSRSSSDVANSLSRQVSRPLLERSFVRKIQSRKVFTHRESFDTIIAKTEEKLSKCRIDYKQCYAAHRQNPTQHSLQQYVDAHNAYVQQLHATNAMLEAYHCDTVPQLLQELEEIYDDLCNIMSEAVLQGAESISSKASDQAKRYDGLVGQCKAVNGFQDLQNFARSIQLPPNAQRVPKKAFAPPVAANAETDENNEYGEGTPPIFKNELIIERGGTLVLRPSLEQLKREAAELETQIRQLQDAVDVLVRTQMRGLEGQLYNKANELQEDISMKKFDLRAKEIHLAAVQAQKELFIKKVEPGSPIGAPGERKLSTSSSSSMKTKWMKAFRSLKPASSSTAAPEKKNGAAAGNSQLSRMGDITTDNHNLQEYTYKKITPCDVCSQVLRGHQRQGLRCRMCKTNVHVECVPQLGKCSVKAKLLRRQKSTSEIDNRVDVDEETEGPLLISRKLSSRGVYNNIELTEQTVDQTYQVLKQAGEISSKTTDTMKTTTSGNINDMSGGGGNNNGATIAVAPQMKDIPVVNVPDYPDRVVVAPPRRGPLKPSSSNQGPNLQPIKQGLTAPAQDVSSSDYRIPVPVQVLPNQTPIGPPIVPQAVVDPGIRRRLFAGFRPLSGFGRLRIKSAQHRSISLPETPHSPRRQKLNLRMKSLSLDSPESTELHGQMRRRYPGPGPSAYYGGSGGGIDHSTPPSNNSKNNSRLHSPSSPSQQQRKLLYASRGLKSGSVDLPDEVDKSLSSASTSPCPSPVRQGGKSHRLLPTNLYVVLYNFKARHQDELDLKAGYKVTVIDTSDPDWWKGKCLGRIGYFPSKYVLKLAAGEKVLQVTHNLQIADTERGDNIALLRDQIVIQTGEEINGMTKIRSADKRQGICPSKYLQEV